MLPDPETRRRPFAWAMAPLLWGCHQDLMVNPSFPVSREEARAALREARAYPRPLERPVVVVAGYLDPGLGPWWFARQVRRWTGDRRILTVQFVPCRTFEQCREKLIRTVDQAYPSDDPVWTAEVDVIGLSMGGLVARLAAAPSGPEDRSRRRLRMARLFTMGSPHQGARMANLPTLLPLLADMRVGSPLIARVNAAPRPYEVHAYAALSDRIVGVENAAPPGETPWWVTRPPIAPSHMGSVLDSRIQADIARKLRGEPPYSRRPPAPVPERARVPGAPARAGAAAPS